LRGYKDLLAYQKAYTLAMDIFEVSKLFPMEEKYSLTDQVRRCSRSVCANIAEGYRKRRYPAHFILKLTDSDAENSETQVWIDFALSCQYLNEAEHTKLTLQADEVGKLMSYMINNHEKFL